jgi:hypothetical protein
MYPPEHYGAGRFELNSFTPAKFVDPRTVIESPLQIKIEASPHSSPALHGNEGTQGFVPISPVSTEYRFVDDNFQNESQVVTPSYNQMNSPAMGTTAVTFKAPVQGNPTAREIPKQTKPKSYDPVSRQAYCLAFLCLFRNRGRLKLIRN